MLTVRAQVQVLVAEHPPDPGLPPAVVVVPAGQVTRVLATPTAIRQTSTQLAARTRTYRATPLYLETPREKPLLFLLGMNRGKDHSVLDL